MNLDLLPWLWTPAKLASFEQVWAAGSQGMGTGTVNTCDPIQTPNESKIVQATKVDFFLWLQAKNANNFRDMNNNVLASNF